MHPGCGCEPVRALTLVHPTLIHQPISTATGPATIPVWSFAVAGSAVRVTASAIPRSLLVEPAIAGQSFDQWDPSVTAHQSGDGSLTISFIGAAAGNGPCSASYTARLVESEHAVAVTIDQTSPWTSWGRRSETRQDDTERLA